MNYIDSSTTGTISAASSATVAITAVKAGQLVAGIAAPTNWTAGTIEIVWSPTGAAPWYRTGSTLVIGSNEVSDMQADVDGYVGLRSKSDFTTSSSVAVSVIADDRVVGAG